MADLHYAVVDVAGKRDPLQCLTDYPVVLPVRAPLHPKLLATSRDGRQPADLLVTGDRGRLAIPPPLALLRDSQ